MKNLAGDKTPNLDIARELRRCRISERWLNADEQGGEVRATIGGIIAGPLGPIEMRRAWYYWVASGPVPMAIADRLYADPVGRDDIRVAGHCGCPPPMEWASGKGGDLYVDTYHTDSEVGLRIFADALSTETP